MGDPGKVKDAAIGSALKIGAKAKSVVATVLKGIPSLIIPFIKTNYEKIYAKENAEMSKIRQKYPDVFRNASQLFTDDAKLAAFLVNPVLMLSYAATKGSLSSVFGLAKSLSARDEALVRDIKRIWQHVNRLATPSRTSNVANEPAKAKAGNEDLYYKEGLGLNMSLLVEDAARAKTEKFINDARFKERLMKSAVVEDIKTSAETIINETLNSIIELAKKIIEIDDIESLESLGNNIRNQVEQKIEQLDPMSAEAAIPSIIESIKASIIDGIIQRLGLSIEEFEKLKLPTSSELISAYQKALDEIKKLA
jgi:hypothetical protein